MGLDHAYRDCQDGCTRRRGIQYCANGCQEIQALQHFLLDDYGRYQTALAERFRKMLKTVPLHRPADVVLLRIEKPHEIHWASIFY